MPAAQTFAASTIAVAGQTPGLSGFQTAVENVTLALALRATSGDGQEHAARDALARVGLAEHADRRVDSLSAGERERVALARAVAAAPAVLIADEPTARLDSLATVAIGELLAELAAEHGTTVICSSHDPLLIELADRELALCQAAGYDLRVAEVTETISVTGFRCERCVARLASVLEGHPGLYSAHGNLMGEVTRRLRRRADDAPGAARGDGPRGLSRARNEPRCGIDNR